MLPRRQPDLVRNYIFGLIWRYYGPKRDILDYWGTISFLYYPIISYQKIKVYMVETMYMGRSHRNNGVSGKNLISISTTVLIVQDKILWYDSYYDLRSYMESYVEYRSIPSKRFV